MSEDVKEIEISMDAAKAKIEKLEVLNRLRKNPDFKAFILDDFMGKERMEDDIFEQTKFQLRRMEDFRDGPLKSTKHLDKQIPEYKRKKGFNRVGWSWRHQAYEPMDKHGRFWRNRGGTLRQPKFKARRFKHKQEYLWHDGEDQTEKEDAQVENEEALEKHTQAEQVTDYNAM